MSIFFKIARCLRQLCFLAAVWILIASSAQAGERPNIVLIVADDMGYGDLGCYGHPVAKTPRIDGLARQGVRFTQHYANGPECSPTRTALLTGRYQQRVGGLECAIGTGNVGRYDDAIRLAENSDLGLPAEPTVLPGALKDADYTCGIFGKWHLEYEPKFNPIEHGWNEFFGSLGGNVHYFNHRELSELHVLTRSFLALGGAKAPSEQLDGYDIIDHVARRRDDFKRTLYWRGRRGERTWLAVRDGAVKYVRQSEGDQSDEWLFDLTSDIGEQCDQLNAKPAETARLKGLLRDWETAVKPQR